MLILTFDGYTYHAPCMTRLVKLITEMNEDHDGVMIAFDSV